MPRKLLKYLKSELTCGVNKYSDGIYYITGERMPVQLLVSKALSEEENLWLHALRGGLEKATLNRVLSKGKTIGSGAGAYVHAVVEANRKLIEGDEKMGVRNVAEILVGNSAFVDELEKLGYGDVRVAAEEAAEEVAERAAERALKRGAKPDDVAYDLDLPLSKVLEIQENLSENG